MRPATFDYYSPDTISETLDLLSKYGQNSKIIAGGQSLVPMMKLRIVSPKVLIDLRRIQDLSYITEDDGRIRIGALSSHYMIESSKLLERKLTALHEAASHVGDRLVRNRGTLGGSVSHADPAADYPPVLLAFDADVQVQGRSGKRKIKASNFFVDAFTTALKNDEILTEVSFPSQGERSGSSHLKFERVAGDFAIVAVSACISVDSNGLIESVGLGLSGVDSVPVKSSEVEKQLVGKPADRSLFETAGELVSKTTNPPSDLRGSSEFRKEMVKVYVADALELAARRASSKDVGLGRISS